MGCCSKKENKTAVELKGDDGSSQDDPPGKYGKKRKFDLNFNGPIQDRSCTDVICCILFLLLLIAMIVVGVLAFTGGNPKRLLYPTDSQGNSCGEGDLKDKKNLFFFDLLECIPKDVTAIYKITSCPTYKICVKECPKKNQLAIAEPNKTELYCKYETQTSLNGTTKTNLDLINSGECAKYTLESTALVYRCVPTVVGDKIKTFLKGKTPISFNGRNLTVENVKEATLAQTVLLNLHNTGQRILSDVRLSWYWIIAAFGITMGVAFLYIMVMRWVAGILVWLTTWLVLTIIGYAVYYCFTEYTRLAATDNSSISFEFTTNLTSYKEKKETWMALGIILAVILAVLLLLLLALRKRIQIAIQLIKEGSKATTSMCSTLFFPIFPWLLQLILFGWFVGVLVFLATTSTAQFNQILNGTVLNATCEAVDAINGLKLFNKTLSCDFQKYITDNNIFRLQVFHFFGWLWIMNFIIAFGQCSLAGAFASWFWTMGKKKDVPALPLMSSIWRTLRYHTGSLAFGSLIIAIIQIIRAMLEYIEYKLKGPGVEPGPVIKFLLKCMKCCFWCLEKFMKFLNKNAYIEIAVYGKNFCVSAKNAFFLLMRNILRVAVLDKVTDFLLFIGKLTITGAMGVASFFFFNKNTDLNYYLTPIIIIVIGAWVVTSAFFGVYEMAIDTILLCFLEDSERHDGSQEKPYYMSKKLRKIIGKKNKVKEEDGDD